MNEEYRRDGKDEDDSIAQKGRIIKVALREHPELELKAFARINTGESQQEFIINAVRERMQRLRGKHITQARFPFKMPGTMLPAPNGRNFLLRPSVELRAKLEWMAEQEDISQNKLICHLLEYALEKRSDDIMAMLNGNTQEMVYAQFGNDVIARNLFFTQVISKSLKELAENEA